MQYYGIKNFYHDIAKDKRYWLPCMFFMILSYGFSAFSRTLSIDDLARIYYVGRGSGMIAATRWGISFWSRLFSTTLYTPFIDKFLALTFIFIALIMMNTIFYEINGRQKHIYIYYIFVPSDNLSVDK